MKKLLFLLLMISAVFFSEITVLNAKADPLQASALIVHYFRYDGDYSDWSLWMWQGSAAGHDFTFTNATRDSYGIKLVIPLAGTNLQGASSIGFLAVLTSSMSGSWVKDVSQDRYIDMTHPDSSGNVNVYLVEGDSRIGYSPDDPNGPDRSDKIISAYFQNLDTINFSVTSPVTESDIVLYQNNNAIVPSAISFNDDSTSGSIGLKSNADVNSTYELKVSFASGDTSTLVVSFQGLYDTQQFADAFTYNGNDLGATWTKTSTTFKLWAPVSTNVQTCIYTTGAPSSVQKGGDDTGTCTDMNKGQNGVWYLILNGDYNGKYYTYKVTNGTTTNEVVDPYAVSTGVNGLRGEILDLSATNPQGWNPTYKPDNVTNPTDAIIYEIDVRDFTGSSTWGGNPAYAGKYLGLTETGTKYNGVSTGLDDLIDLGVTSVQLMPVFDFGSIDETNPDAPYNWGYDPVNYNVPEGSYSTNPYDGAVRVNEFKQMVEAMHDHGIRVNMDVVYNHTDQSADSNFNEIVPDYYYRMNPDGTFSNGSGTGNELASERPMVRKFIMDSVKYWADEYDIDGFRFDLMALEDTTTMTDVAKELHAINPTIMVYGEPWTGGTTTLPDSEQTNKNNLAQVPGVAAFNDVTRDAIKGSYSDATSPGWIQGQFDKNVANVEYGILGGVSNPILGSGFTAWNTEPTKTINYVSCHDNNTLYDKLAGSEPNATTQQLQDLQEQANGIILTSEGIPFLSEGVDFMRTKDGNSNSYNAPDSVNQIDWSLKAKNMNVFNYYKGMIALRKAHPAFRMTTAEEVNQNLSFINTGDPGLIEYEISNYANGDTWKNILVVDNGHSSFKTITLPEGNWNLVAEQNQAGTKTISTSSGNYVVRGNETLVFYQGLKSQGPAISDTIIFIVAGIVILAGGTALFLKKRKA